MGKEKEKGKGKASIGRQKIEIKRIECVAARNVCFSKRRQGLFKKASELSILCGAMVGVVVFSPAGRPFTLGSPSIKSVIDKYFHTLDNHSSHTMDHGIHNFSGVESALMLEYKELKELMEAEKIRIKKLEEEIEEKGCGSLMRYMDISGLGSNELPKICKKLEAMKDVLMGMINQVDKDKQLGKIDIDHSFVSGVEEVAGSVDCRKDPFDG